MIAYEYRCPYVPGDSPDWAAIPAVTLASVLNGETPRLRTFVRICRTDAYVRVRFECEDDHVVATYANRDDPLYKEDVVEIFLDEDGNGRFYKELELSPRNVVFDAMIDKEEGQVQKVDPGWNMDGLHTLVEQAPGGDAVCELAMPLASFDRPPRKGMSWRINLYRIDNDACGGRHYWAWSPTGARNNFHVPSRFGHLIFE